MYSINPRGCPLLGTTSLGQAVYANYYLYNLYRIKKSIQIEKQGTGTRPLTQIFVPGINRFKGKLRYGRSILVLKPQNGEYESPKSMFS